MYSILKKKVFLYFTEFFAGMSVMAVELGASRLLAPYFSSSQIVWTIIIGTIMIAMALGNIYGGRRADKDPNPDRLYVRILIAALWIGLIPVVGKYIILGISAVVIFSVNTNYLIWAAFAACMIIFVFPLFLLGTVTPSLAKYTMENLEDNAKTVGTLGAANTIGSIIGTFVPTFITIPAVGTAVTFLIFSGILLALSVIYFISRKVRSKTLITGLIIFCLSCGLGHSSSFAFWENELTYEGESIYNYLQVKDLNDRVILSTNVLFGVQSLLMKEDGLSGMFYDYAMAGPLMADVMGRAERQQELSQLILGMGAGTYAKQCEQYFDNTIMEGVEIDSKITALAKKYFKLPEDVKVTTYDGRAYLNAVKQKYDVIMVDAYQDITIPFQMSSIEFFEQVQAHLTENGVLVVNMNMRGQKEGNINQYLSDTISRVFSQVYTVEVPYSTNRILYASDNEDMLKVFEENRAKISQQSRYKAHEVSAQNRNNEELSNLMSEISANVTEYQAGEYVMTDDSAPVELLGMQVIDELIEEELVWYKKAYEQDGVKGLLESIG